MVGTYLAILLAYATVRTFVDGGNAAGVLTMVGVCGGLTVIDALVALARSARGRRGEKGGAR
jgi:hypothetical protein